MQKQSITSPLFGDPRLPARFWAKVEVQPNGCWLWMASLDTDGYGQLRVGSRMDGSCRTTCAHRFAYEALVGAVPKGLEIDHLCRNRACVNPSDMEPVVHAENVRRGNAGVPQRLRTHCPQGHHYDATNTHWRQRGLRRWRRCRTCENRRRLDRYYRTRQIEYALAKQPRQMALQEA